MQDRVSKYPGRVTLIPVQGLENTYTMKRADEPTQPGTPLNKSTLLTDATANLMGGAVQTPDDAFKRLLLLSQTGGMVIAQVTSSDGSPVENLKVTGLLDIAKKPVFTDSGGRAVGIAESGKRTIGISGYADVVDSTQSVQIESGSIYELSFTVSSRNYLNISSTRKIMFSPNVATIDYDVVGAGGAGGGSYSLSRDPSGGGGGAVQRKTGVTVTANQEYTATIGAGGTTSDYAGGDGGNSTFLDITSSGGKGGSPDNAGAGGSPGGGDGGASGADGKAGGTRFSSFTAEKQCSGGGGGGGGDSFWTPLPGKGGAGGGGAGGGYQQNGSSGSEPGAGGGGGGFSKRGSDSLVKTYGGKGHDGCVDIRMHLIVTAK